MRAIGNPEEGEAYKRYNSTLSLVAWVGILLIAVSAVAFWREHPGILNSQKILTKIVLTVIVAINGGVMVAVLRPKIEALKGDDWTKRSKLEWAAGPGAIFGAISIISWYTLLILGAVGRTGWTATQIAPWYLGSLIVAWAAGTLLVRHRLARLS